MEVRTFLELASNSNEGDSPKHFRGTGASISQIKCSSEAKSQKRPTVSVVLCPRLRRVTSFRLAFDSPILLSCRKQMFQLPQRRLVSSGCEDQHVDESRNVTPAYHISWKDGALLCQGIRHSPRVSARSHAFDGSSCFNGRAK